MAENRRGNFWLLIVGMVLCCVVFPIPVVVFAARVRIRWLWYVVGAGVLSLALVFLAISIAPRVPDPSSSSGTRTETTAFSSVSVFVFLAVWVATMIIMFMKRDVYEASFLRDGKSLNLATPQGSAVPQGGRPSPAPPGPSAFQLRTKRAGAAAEASRSEETQRLGSAAPLRDINALSVEELVGLGISEASAVAIVTRRGQIGAFTAAVQVQAVPGLAPHEWARLRDRVEFGLPATPRNDGDAVADPESGRRREEPRGDDRRDDEGPRPGGRIVDI